MTPTVPSALQHDMTPKFYELLQTGWPLTELLYNNPLESPLAEPEQP